MQDLSGGNVMLTSCSINPHGFQAKVGDFGLSRDADASARIAGNLYGTISHMAPEVMLEVTAGAGECPAWLLLSILMQQRTVQHRGACFGQVATVSAVGLLELIPCVLLTAG